MIYYNRIDWYVFLNVNEVIPKNLAMNDLGKAKTLAISMIKNLSQFRADKIYVYDKSELSHPLLVVLST